MATLDALKNMGNIRQAAAPASPLLTAIVASAGPLIVSEDVFNLNAKGVEVNMNLTALTAGTIQVSIQGKDEQTGLYYTILASAAVAAPGVTNLIVYPGIAVVANASASRPMPPVWRIRVDIAGGNATATFTVNSLL
jgi:hypothetical protein